MKIELIKTYRATGEYFAVKVNGMTENLFSDQEEAQELYDKLVYINSNPKPDELIKSIEI